MSTPGKASIALRAFCSLVFTMGLAGPHGTAWAQSSSGAIDFCDPTVYQNTTLPSLQNSGLFTDVPRYGKAVPLTGYRPDETCRHSSSSDPACNTPQAANCGTFVAPCRLQMCGIRYANINDMWITVLGAPGTAPPTSSCWDLKANVQISVHNNAKGVGFITNYDPSTKQGLYFGLYDSGSYVYMALSTFDASVSAGSNIPMNQVGTNSAKASDNLTGWYTLSLDICSGKNTVDGSGPNYLSAIGSFQPVVFTAPDTWTYAYPPGTCPNDYAPNQVCFRFNGLLPTSPAISASGAAGIAGFLHSADQAQTIDENASVTKFTYVSTNVNPD